jgi:hypothetical protein
MKSADQKRARRARAKRCRGHRIIAEAAGRCAGGHKKPRWKQGGAPKTAGRRGRTGRHAGGRHSPGQHQIAAPSGRRRFDLCESWRLTRASVTPTFYKNRKICANRSAYKKMHIKL